MPTYVSLVKWTDQGIRSVKDTVDRTEQVGRQAIEAAGGRLTGVWWTQGAFDMVTVSDWPDEESAMTFLLGAGMAGNVRTETLRAFSADDLRRILAKLG
jgi:uncharacterized protein with GYD domain